MFLLVYNSASVQYLLTNSLLDPEVSALSTLTNVQNSLFVPDLFGFVNREPTYTLSPPQAESSPEEEGATTDTSEPHPEPTKLQEPRNDLQQIQPLSSISSVLDAADPRFAILPEESNLEGWTKEDVEELNDHVRHMLHSRRNKFKRAMKGFGQYVSKRRSPSLLIISDLHELTSQQPWDSSLLYTRHSSLFLVWLGFFSLLVSLL